MKQITYAGDSLLTSDAVASALIELTACLAKKGIAEAVSIPVVKNGTATDAELVIGVGNDVLAVPADPDEDGDGDGVDIDDAVFTAAADDLRAKLDSHSGTSAAQFARASDIDSYLDDYPVH
ncbi:hypothetical protein SCB71_03950 [Herbiconiux sp. KACC 21604]|uniref:hypothetical protein n=1 Tax=unclassified Herbiconiux TaxID=2618217 RepID=UPI0014910480|nr:hypothetical protein [Herbiconiux sp. SALV-R1]QJU52527.1 hypothetical protein HL652_01915 [Herbiconiux sp. SALV-R1]WPO87403.1 hypothetical protein SCB71_03950 [Herbiconiux sp. KACC 21604]